MASTQVKKESTLGKGVRQPQNGASVTMNNNTSTEMTLDRSYNWSGTPAKPGFPNIIIPNYRAMFTHLRDGNFGSKASVIYSGLNEKKEPCAWVLAWYAPADSSISPNQVFVLCGPKPVIDILSFDEIVLLLDKSIQHSEFIDPKVSKTHVAADIDDDTPNAATLVAKFELVP
ncbi:hypothetical protein vseg_001379 [Gypsophila vaccaria]